MGEEKPDLFKPHPNSSDEINRNIAESEMQGGVDLGNAKPGTWFEVETRNCIYTIEYLGNGEALISGHPKFCPEPTRVRIAGSTWGGSMLKLDFIGRGMHLEFVCPRHGIVVTSTISEIREVQKPPKKSTR